MNFCDHANENPARCSCPLSCECYAGTCRNRIQSCHPWAWGRVQKFRGRPPRVALTERERAIVNALADAWNLWCELPDVPAHVTAEFMHAIHEAQRHVAARVAYRAEPELWRGDTLRGGRRT